MKKLFLLFLLFVFPVLTSAQTPASSIALEQAWARASATKTGAVYLTIRNTGALDDRLVSVAASVADGAQLHTTINDNGVMEMRPVTGIDVKANSQTTLSQSGLHIMLIGLKGPLKAGDSFPLSATFEKAGKLTVTVKVLKAGVTGDMKPMEGMKM